MAKYLEKNAKKGELSRIKVKGKKCIELGAGMGLAGMAFALLGADVALTDITDPVLALLRRNVDSNMTKAALNLKDAAWAVGVAGKVSVSELDWSNKSHYAALEPPYDYVIAADCVYSEVAVPHFLNAVQSMTGPKSIVVVCNEFRSSTVNDLFMAEFSRHFSIKKVAMNKMDSEYQHPLIHIYIMKKLKKKGGMEDEEESAGAAEGTEAAKEGEKEKNDVDASVSGVLIDPDKQFEALATSPLEENEASTSPPAAAGDAEKSEESERFATRRQGAALAQKLAGIKLDCTEDGNLSIQP